MRGARRRGGFTLLEVMVALAILATALVLLVQSATMSAAASGHARQLTLATLLARQKIADLEDRLYHDGFSEFPESEEGDFSDQGHEEVRWSAVVEKVELPEGIGAAAARAAEQLKASAASGSGNQATLGQVPGLPPELIARMGMQDQIMGMFAGAFSMFVDQIRQALEDSIRRVKLTVTWKDRGADRSFEVVSYFTDARKIDAVMGLGGPPPQGPPQGPPQNK